MVQWGVIRDPYNAVMSADVAFRVLVVCAWCPDSAEATEWARNHDYTVSHGMCPKCREGFADEVRCVRASHHPFGK